MWEVVDTGQRHAWAQSWPEARLNFYNGRWYNPQLSRFIQPDTIISELGNPGRGIDMRKLSRAEYFLRSIWILCLS